MLLFTWELSERQVCVWYCDFVLMQQQREYNWLEYGNVNEPLILLSMAISSSASFFCASGFGFGAAGNVTKTILILSLLPCNKESICNK